MPDKEVGGKCVKHPVLYGGTDFSLASVAGAFPTARPSEPPWSQPPSITIASTRATPRRREYSTWITALLSAGRPYRAKILFRDTAYRAAIDDGSAAHRPHPARSCRNRRRSETPRVTAVMMREPPGAPTVMNNLPSRRMMVGVIAESGRFPGGWYCLRPAPGRTYSRAPGFAAKSSISLLSRKPRPGTVMPFP